MRSVFVSLPHRREVEFKEGLEGFRSLLKTKGLRPRTLGETDFATENPLDEVLALMDQCAGAIILGYPRMQVENAAPQRDGGPTFDGNALHPTEWNHIEAAVACAKGLPLLLIAHEGIGQGIFDRGATRSFVYGIDLADPKWADRAEVGGAIDRLKSQFRSRFIGVWRYKDKEGVEHERVFTVTNDCYLRQLQSRLIWKGTFETLSDDEAMVHSNDGHRKHVLLNGRAMRAEEWTANRVE